jgi:hypothetical protein
VTIEMAVRDFVAGVTAVAALVSTRVYQLTMPQTPTFPAVRVLLADDPVIYALDGPMRLRKAIVQIDAFDQEASGVDPYVSVAALATAIDDAVSGYTGPMPTGSPSLDVRGVFRTDRKATYDPDELRVLRIIQLYDVWYRA